MMTQEINGLMQDFPPVTKQQWIEQVMKDLKGAAFDTLEYTNADGIKVAPFYTLEDGTGAGPLFSHTDWEIIEQIAPADDATANAQALHVLNNGITGLQVDVTDETDFDLLLKDVTIEHIALQLAFAGNPAKAMIAFDTYLQTHGLDRRTLNLSCAFDPIHTLVTTGSWPVPETQVEAQFQAFARANAGARNICVEGAIYHEAGGSPAYQIACMLAHANEYLHWNEGTGLAPSLQLNTAVGPDYFTEIAKHRAIRKVFALLLRTYNVQDTIYIHSTSARRNLTVYDAYNNLLRTSTGAMAAVAGGCNSLRILPFDDTYAPATEFGSRLARNIQLMLKGESHFDKVSDVAAGSYFIESLTEAFAAKAWNYFQEIASAGGMIAALKTGMIQTHIAATAQKEQQLFDEGKMILVGTNKFTLPEEQMSSKLQHGKANYNEGSTISPLQPQRLAAKLEHERLNGEKAAV